MGAPFFFYVAYGGDMELLEKIKYWLWEATKVLGLIVAVSLLVSILFGHSAHLFGNVLYNLGPVISTLGCECLGLVVAIIIILAVWNSRS